MIVQKKMISMFALGWCLSGINENSRMKDAHSNKMFSQITQEYNKSLPSIISNYHFADVRIICVYL